MKLATIQSGESSIVVVVDAAHNTYRPFSDVLPDWKSSPDQTMVGAIKVLAGRKAVSATEDKGISLAGVQLLAPILRPPQNVICVGKNYHAHAHEFTKSGFDAGASLADAIPKHPIVFTKPHSALSGPYDDIPLWPGLDTSVDYEAELAVIIGKRGRFIAKSDALDYVFGYTIINDVTARDLQHRHKQWFLGKGIDGFGPMGPWIVTRDEIDLATTRISATVNGEPRQDASTADLIFDVPTLISTISHSVTLSPGDIIATGTPVGVGIGFDPPKFLKAGDVVEIEISGIGKIRNVVKKASDIARFAESTHITSELIG